MNSNDQNGYSNISAKSINTVRYPLANDNTTALKNMNYKEYLRMSERYNTKNSGDLNVMINGKDAVKTAIGIVGKLLSTLGVPGVGLMVSLYAALVDAVWPNGKSQWEIFMEQVEDLINQKIAEYARSKALAELEGLGDNFQLYLNALTAWKENPDDASILHEVQYRFENLDGFFTQYMPSFRVSGYEVPLLTVYAQAANLHLLLLRDASVFGEEWGFSPTLVDNYYNRQMDLTANYSDHCVKWYNIGLGNLSGSTAHQWLDYNRFRTQMTLTVLDIVALFQNYDVRTYKIATTSQLTREVYTEPIGIEGQYSWYDKAPSFSAIESTVIREPHVFDSLTGFSIYTGLSRYSASNYLYLWQGHKTFHQQIGSPYSFSDIHGNIKNYSSISELDFYGGDVYRTQSTAGVLFAYTTPYYGVPKVDFNIVNPLNNNRDTVTYNPGNEGIGAQTHDSEVELPPETIDQPDYEVYSHKLCHAGMIQFPNNPHNPYVPVFSWSHRSADNTNTIYSDRITQIPAIKSLPEGNWGGVEKGPGFTGGDVTMARYENGDTLKDVVKLHVTIDPDALSQKFRVRLRYASTSNIPATLFTSDSGDRGFDLKATGQSPFTGYNDFQYVDVPGVITFTKTSDLVTVYLHMYAAQNSTIYIDKVEFIPLDETYEAEKDLNTAKKAVNALFTNTKEALKIDVTDYQVNQAQNLVECLSDDLYPDEKQLLFDAVKEAKRLGQVRNFIQK
ncbi:pesticidal protein [Bacillus cereus]|nr:pesticidal protein [Bacillus cereus]